MHVSPPPRPFLGCTGSAAVCELPIEVASPPGGTGSRGSGFSGCSTASAVTECGSRCLGFSTCGAQPQQSRSVALDAWASVLVAQELSCSAACGISPDQREDPCPLHWQADSYPLCYQKNPKCPFY